MNSGILSSSWMIWRYLSAISSFIFSGDYHRCQEPHWQSENWGWQEPNDEWFTCCGKQKKVSGKSPSDAFIFLEVSYVIGVAPVLHFLGTFHGSCHTWKILEVQFQWTTLIKWIYTIYIYIYICISYIYIYIYHIYMLYIYYICYISSDHTTVSG